LIDVTGALPNKARRETMRTLPLAIGLALGCASDSALTTLRGELSPDRGHQPLTVTECGTGRVYEIGGGDTLYYYFMSRAEELRSTDPSAPILVELQGETAKPTTSAAERGAQGAFYLRRLSPTSLQHGRCADGKPGPR